MAGLVYTAFPAVSISRERSFVLLIIIDLIIGCMGMHIITFDVTLATHNTGNGALKEFLCRFLHIYVFRIDAG